jgi:hypothetical protein
MLDLRDTPITDVGLEQLTGLTKLRRLLLRGNRVTGDGTMKLREALPKCAISIEPAPKHAGSPAQSSARVRLERVGQIPDQDDYTISMAVQGKHAYLVNGTLRVVDISEPSRPRVVSRCDMPGSITAIVVAGRYAYVSSEKHLRIVDLSDATTPRIVGSCKLGVSLWSMSVTGHYVVGSGGIFLYMVDISDPAAPKEVGRCKLVEAHGLALAGQYAFVAADIHGLRVVDISDPKAPKEIAAFEEPSGAMQVAVAGKHAYITGGEDGVALWIVDISDPKRPKEVTRYGNWLTGGVAVQDNYAYLASGNLHVLDVSDPGVPKEVGFFDTADEECTVAWRVAVAGNHVYVAGQGEQGFSILRADWAKKQNDEPRKQ